jgi:DNA topoisomerase-2
MSSEIGIDSSNSRYVRKQRSVEDIDVKTDVQHVYDIPDTYIGSVDPEERYDYLLEMTVDPKTNQVSSKKLVYKKISLSRGIERLFLEIISNAGDNADASRRFKINPGSIDVSMVDGWITVRNGGAPIPVQHHPKFPGKYAPDVIFGTLRSSTNYDTNVIRMGCGRNGFGAKLTNIFSKAFQVKIGDSKNKREYTGMWQNNMKDGPHTTVEENYTGENYVQVSWLLDFKRFGLEKYPSEAIGLFARYVADFSFTCKVPVSFNGVQMNYSNIRDYASLLYDEEKCKTAILHYEWPNHDKDHPNGISPFGPRKQNVEQAVSLAEKAEHIPLVEMLILDTPDEAKPVSYVNGLMTIDGGVHLNQAFGEISSLVVDSVNSAVEAEIKKKKKNNDGMVVPKITVEDVRQHVSVILNCRLPDPKYNSQSKTKLENPRPHIHIDKSIMKTVERWSLIDRLRAALDAKIMNKLKRTNGTRSKHLSITDGEDANDAGTERSNDCILYLVEGKSASSYPKKRISYSAGGKDLAGWFPLRGKFLNVRNLSLLQVADNKEVKAIKEMIGLREGIDYTKEENLITLRYGYIMITVDADSDGFHIASLLINYFDKFYNGLLKSGRIGLLRTPVVRIKNNKDEIVHRFFSNSEFEKWSSKNIIDGKMPKGLQRPVYYKGLGTNENEDIKNDLTFAPVVTIFYDEEADTSLFKAFDKTMADSRKEWIAKWREMTNIDDVIFENINGIKKQRVTHFINHELIDYTIDALFRTIPSFDDGLKRSHRQAIFAGLNKFRFGRRNEPLKVAQFAANVAETTNYHHGEMSMCGTITKLAQKFTGSNNLPVFEGRGQFGTRSEMGNDAASPRYIFAIMPDYTPLLYDEEVISIIPRRVIEGEECEPIYLPATIPMHLVNGAMGVATGYSTFIPNHNYYDVINWLKERCMGNLVPNKGKTLKIWYRGFEGTMSLKGEAESESQAATPTSIKDEEEEAYESDNEPDNLNREDEMLKASSYRDGRCFISRGNYKITPWDKEKKRVDVIVTELPVGRSILSYKNWLLSLINDKPKDVKKTTRAKDKTEDGKTKKTVKNTVNDEKLILDYRDNSTTEKPNFTIKGVYVPNESAYKYNMHKILQLERPFSLTNLVMIDENGYPQKFKDTSEILEKYYERMIGLYGRVKQQRLIDIRNKMEDLIYRIHFITAVINNKIVVSKRKRADILADMKAYTPSIPDKYLDLVKIAELTEEEVQKSYEEHKKLEELFKKTSEFTAQQLWLEKLESLEAYIKKHEKSKTLWFMKDEKSEAKAKKAKKSKDDEESDDE